ncbi:hypothetical protein POM88_048942 [Heracleum sosnowskyi]|uniref:K+ potassium transporter integral membrane domain-containing protein n=1 Tax=Heracleum sosnowskyi TaxID=360622 RepID=A0AAD8GW28_9APIA|nr:hypothetical protein POM88_048942 [Heracleum sosnowskyi]
MPSMKTWLKGASKLKSKLEKSQFSNIEVLSAVGGMKQASNKMTEDMILWISVAVLVALFMVQRFGTDKVGYTFAPILFIWFILIVGLYNFIKYDPSVIKALNPMHIVYYFERDKKQAWMSLGGTVLSITAIVLQYMGQSSYLRKQEMDALNAFYKAVPDNFSLNYLSLPFDLSSVLAYVCDSCFGSRNSKPIFDIWNILNHPTMNNQSR